MKIVTRKKASEQVATEMTENDFKEVTKLSKSLGIEKLGDLQQLYEEQREDNEGVLDFLRRKNNAKRDEVDVINEAFEDWGVSDPLEDIDDDVTPDAMAGFSQEARNFLSQEGNHIYTEVIRSFEADFDSPTSLLNDKAFCNWLLQGASISVENPECEYFDDYEGVTYSGEVSIDDFFNKTVKNVHYERPVDGTMGSVTIVATIELDGDIILYSHGRAERVYQDQGYPTMQRYDEKTLSASGTVTVFAHYDDASGETYFDDAVVEEMEYSD